MRTNPWRPLPVWVLRKVEVYAQHAAIAAKLRGVLMSAQRKEVSEMQSPTVLSMRFSQNAIFRGVDVASDLGKGLQGGSAYKWLRTPLDASHSWTQSVASVVRTRSVSGDARIASVVWYGTRAGVCRLSVGRRIWLNLSWCG